MDALHGKQKSIDCHLLVEWLMMLELSEMLTASFTLVAVFGPYWKPGDFNGWLGWVGGRAGQLDEVRGGMNVVDRAGRGEVGRDGETRCRERRRGAAGAE